MFVYLQQNSTLERENIKEKKTYLQFKFKLTP